MTRTVVGRRRLGAGALGIALLGAVWAVPAPSSVGANAAAAEGAARAAELPAECSAWARTSCLLPFPSGRFEVADASTPTGYRLELPDGYLSDDVGSQLGPGAQISDVLAGADGASIVTPISFETFERFDPESLPADGGDVVALLDVATGDRVPIRVEVNRDASWVDPSAEDTVVTAWPADSLEPSHRYVAVLTTALRGRRGASLTAAPGLSADDPYANRLRADLAAVGVDPASLLNATSFNTRSREGVIDEVERMAQEVRADDHPVRGVKAAPGFGGWGTTVTGWVRTTDFRDGDGVIANAAQRRAGTWTKFVATIPKRPASAAGAPVQIYGHGLGVFKESLVVVAGENARKGVATIAIDVPNHGDRIGDGGYLLTNNQPSKLGRTTSMIVQGELDTLSLVLALRGQLARTDVHPYRPLGRSGDGRPDFDVARLSYSGTSMGSVLGARTMAFTPEISHAFLQVGGAGILDIMDHSLLWEVFRGFVPKGASPGDRVGLLGAASLMLDRSDPAWTLADVADSGSNVFLQYAMDDGIVSNPMSERMARGLGLPLYGTVFEPVRGLVGVRSSAVPTHAAEQVSQNEDAGLAQGFLAHLGFSDPEAVRTYRAWLTQALREQGVA